MNGPASNASLLVVDDTVENLRLLASMLGEHGYEVRPVPSGRLALEAAASDPPDLILLDITMPEMDGYEVCAGLRKIDALKDVPVIFLTALSDTADKLKAFAAGGADYITKPFQIEEVLARVRVHLELRRAQRELRQNYERLQALERLRDDLVQMVVHDMRSPLTVIVGNLQLLKDDASEALGDQGVQDLMAAVRAADGLNRMANDLLDVSRLEEGKLPLALEPTDVMRLAGSVQQALARWDRTRAIEIGDGKPATIMCDGKLVHRVLENLVNNAIKHTPAGGRISIRVTSGAQGVRVAVADEGPGVPADARDTIFEKFGTLATRKDRRYHSAGLGLAFCKMAVTAHGGVIGVDSGVPNGSIFWFELPHGGSNPGSDRAST